MGIGGVNRRFPELASGQWAVVCVEASTGIVCMPDGRWAGPDDQPYIVFSSRAAAQEFARATVVAKPTLECPLHDRDSAAVETIRNVEPEGVKKRAADDKAVPDSSVKPPRAVSRLIRWLRRR